MTNLINALVLSLRLLADDSSATAERACEAVGQRDSDAWSSCVCELDTWRCEAQGWCSEPEAAPLGLAALLTPPSMHHVSAGCE
jgi:hypothetical protein